MTTDARQQITDALLTYCRGIDRLDPDAVRAAFHPGALLIDYAPEPVTIEAFADRAVESLGARFVATQHRVSNLRIEFEDDRTARLEAYVLAYHVEASGDRERLHTFNGRYVDRVTEVGGEWRIAQRTLRVDWSKVEDIEQPMRGAWPRSGRAGSPDPLGD